MNYELTNREFLINLREKANQLSETKKLDKQWKRAYENLADSLDKLDAMYARISLNTQKK